MDVEKTPAPTYTCPSGDSSLRSACPAHGALPAINLQHELLGFVLFPLSPAAVAPHVAEYIIGFDFDEVRDAYGERFAVFWQGLVAMFHGHHSAQAAFVATDNQQTGEVQGDARAQFEAWHCEKFKTRWQTGAPTRDMHNGKYADNYGPAEQQERWELWQAAVVASQPGAQYCAPTGKQQGCEVQRDALSAAAQSVIEAHDGPDFISDAQVNALRAALAARQLEAQRAIGEIVASPDGGLQIEFYDGKPLAPMKLYGAPAQGIALAAGVRAIADERQRQVHSEGFSAENDADYKAGVLANAALAYLQVAAMDLAAGGRTHIATETPPACWPWHRLWWKPQDTRRDLVRAGALIAAQLDAIDRQRDAAAGVSS